VIKLPWAVSATGTQDGMTPPQLVSAIQVLRDGKPQVLIHGCCIGGDDDWDTAAADLGIDRIGVPAEHVRSVLESVMRGRTGSRFSYQPSGPAGTREPPLVRNRKIVKLGQALVAAPKGIETKRSGTWATVRLARRAKKPVIIIWPDGRIEEER
jgi:hypothetical protein